MTGPGFLFSIDVYRHSDGTIAVEVPNDYQASVDEVLFIIHSIHKFANGMSEQLLEHLGSGINEYNIDDNT